MFVHGRKSGDVVSIRRRLSTLLLDGQKELEFWRQLLLAVKAIGKVDAADATIRVDLYSKRLNIVGTVSTTSEIGEIKLDLIPTIVESHRHGTNKGLYTRCTLVVGRTEPSSHILIVQDLHFKGKVLFQVLDDHHQKR